MEMIHPARGGASVALCRAVPRISLLARRTRAARLPTLPASAMTRRTAAPVLAALLAAAAAAAVPLRAQDPTPAPAAPTLMDEATRAGLTWTMPDTAGQPRVRVTGWVVDAKTGEPLAGARLGIPWLRTQAVTGRDGGFVLERVPAGSWPVMVRHLGYRAEIMLVPVEAAGSEVSLSLSPETMVLEGLAVVTDRFERRRRAAARSVRVLEGAELGNATGTARDVVMRRLGLVEVPCESMLGQAIFTAGPCARVRGFAAPVAVWIDERPAPGGLDALDMYDASELSLVESYAGGAMVRVYTPPFLDRAARTGLQPEPLF
jgi:hypothetical protein